MAWTIDVFGDETAALAEVADLRGLRVLEVGAGEGRLTWRFAGQTASVLAIDPDEERIAQAREELPAELAERVRLEVMDAVELDVPKQSFDFALLSWSL
ncbi:MAG TPA: class I SAM-dependent methyltransferase [Gaiellaceae bacterium]|jgi:ubiquinone/menaquinone biosynthesis C-methylase UbiE